jgi:hypothetical protein
VRRGVAAGILLAVLGGGAFLGIRALFGGDVLSLDVSTWRTYGDGGNGWSLRYPPGWRTQPLTRHCFFGRYEGGVIVTNTSFAFRNPQGGVDCWGRFVLAGFPSDGVALEWKALGYPLLATTQPDTTFPIRFEDLVHTDAIRGGPAVSFLAVWLNRQPGFQVRVWIGRDASEVDREAIGRVLSSIRLLRVPSPD